MRSCVRRVRFRRGEARPPTGLIVDYTDTHLEKFGVTPICHVPSGHDVTIAPSTFYDARRARATGPTPAQVRDAEPINHVKRVHTENYGVHGARKGWTQVNWVEITVARCTVERLMKTLGLQWCGTAKSSTPQSPIPQPRRRTIW